MNSKLKSQFQPEPDELACRLINEYQLSEQFLSNYSCIQDCQSDLIAKNFRSDLIQSNNLYNIGIYDMPNSNKADVVLLNNQSLCALFKQNQNSLTTVLLQISEFYQHLLSFHAKSGEESDQIQIQQTGVYYSRLLRYASAKRKDIYDALITYGETQYSGKVDAQLKDMFYDILRIGLHVAQMREEAKDQLIYKEDEILTEKDPFVKFLAIILRQFDE